MNRDDKLAFYKKAVEAHPQIVIKGKKSAYTAVNGHMFSFLSPDPIMAIRLSKEGQAAFIENHDSGPVIQYNSVMRDYVSVPDDVLKNTQIMADYIKESFDYVSSLKPKPTKKK